MVKLENLVAINPNGFIYLSIGAQMRIEEKEIPGLREIIFPQLEIEVVNMDAEYSMKITLDILPNSIPSSSYSD